MCSDGRGRCTAFCNFAGTVRGDVQSEKELKKYMYSSFIWLKCSLLEIAWIVGVCGNAEMWTCWDTIVNTATAGTHKGRWHTLCYICPKPWCARYILKPICKPRGSLITNISAHRTTSNTAKSMPEEAHSRCKRKFYGDVSLGNALEGFHGFGRHRAWKATQRVICSRPSNPLDQKTTGICIASSQTA